jgi:hypothetical protein
MLKSPGSVPPRVIPVILSDTVVLALVTVKLRVGLTWPRGEFPKPNPSRFKLTAVAVALRITLLGLLTSESVTMSLATFEPAVVGVKSTTIVQLPGPGTLLAHVELGSAANSESEYDRFVSAIGTAPMLVRVKTGLALPVVPSTAVPKSSCVAETLRAAPPEPENVMVVGLDGSESIIVSVPSLGPDVFGVKSVFTVQLLDAGIEEPQVELESSRNSLSEYVRLVSATADELKFVIVNAALVVLMLPTGTVPKVKLVAEN